MATTEIPATVSEGTESLLFVDWTDETQTTLKVETWLTVAGAKSVCFGVSLITGSALADLQAAVAPPA